MTKRLLTFLATAVVAFAAFASVPRAARAAWCWPDCNGFGYLGPYTTTYNGCWYPWGEVCSGWNTWTGNGINKRCYPFCDSNGYTQARVLYGFENSERIRGWVTDMAINTWIYPYLVGMGGYLRAQVSWWSYTDGRTSYTSSIHVGAV